MATLCISSAPIYLNAFTPSLRLPPFICKSMTKKTSDDVSLDLRRRSANYQPSPWDHHSLLSIKNKYANEKEVITRDMLKKKVKKILDAELNTCLEQLELIDDLQRLGISHHFELEINDILTDFHHGNEINLWKCDNEEDLYVTALGFRLLRQHGFDISEDVFDVIVDKVKNDTFKSDDIKSITTLYEASYLSTNSDTKLHKIIRPFAIEQLRGYVNSDQDDETYKTCEKAIHALEMPYHWRMKRLETRLYIDEYEKKHDMNLALMELAKIDFNIVQASHQEDLKYATRWWKETCLSKQLPFVRDAIVQNFIWTVGIVYEPQFGYTRRTMTKVHALITTIDDIYDIYGTLEELELFTTIVDNWDVNRLDELPEYMRLCFLVLYNEINDIGYDILKDKNINVIPFLRKSWADLCKTYLVEAKWYRSGYKPSLEEYMQNAWISSSAPVMLVHLYCVFSDQISIQILETLSENRQNVARCSSIVLRLANDLATSPDELARGDVLKSVQCYMHETGESEEVARGHVQQMMSDTWNEMNYETKIGLLPRGYLEASMNIARMSQCIYQHGDGHGCPDKAKTVERVMSLLISPVPLD